MKLFKIIGLIISIGFWGEVHGQMVATLSADTIVLGDTTILTIQNADNYPTAGILGANDIEVLGQLFDKVHGKQTSFLSCYDPGTHYIRLGENDSLRLVVLGVDLNPTSNNPKDIADDADIVELEDSLNTPASGQDSFPWLWVVAAAVAVGALLAWLWWRRKRGSTTAEPSQPIDTRTPRERALERLATLRKDQLWQSGRVKEYYTELTDTLRVFIEEATGIRATEMTSEECLNALIKQSDNQAIKQSSNQALKRIFTTSDLVKFAKCEPLPHEHQQAYDDAVEFVKSFWEQYNRKEEADA